MKPRPFGLIHHLAPKLNKHVKDAAFEKSLVDTFPEETQCNSFE